MSDNIHRSAKFDHTLRYRFELRRWWVDWVDYPMRWVAWLMSNPSTADGEKDDPTIKRVIHFSHSWGYDGAIIVNTSPVIGSTPAAAARAMAEDGDYGQQRVNQNFGFIADAGAASALRIAAFGANPFYRLSARTFESFGLPIHCLAKTQDGSPIHPLARGRNRVPNDAQPQVWRTS